MKKIGFIGAFDKINLIMYVAKILRDMDYKVLVIDGTILQKSRYIVPTISHTKIYVTEFEKIDFAVGFQNIEQIMQYFKVQSMMEEDIPYDYVLIDVDNRVAFKTFDMLNSEKIYFVSGFDLYSLKKGLDIFSNLEQQIKVTKILFSNNVTSEDEEYLNYLSLDKSVIWDDEITIYFPLLDSDNEIFDQNQRIEKIKVKSLSNDYQQSLIYVVQNITGNQSTGSIKKSIVE